MYYTDANVKKNIRYTSLKKKHFSYLKPPWIKKNFFNLLCGFWYNSDDVNYSNKSFNCLILFFTRTIWWGLNIFHIVTI